MFRNGVPTDYTGPRKADGIISYMNKQSLPAVTVLTSETHDDFTKADKVVVIAYGDAKHPVPKSFVEYANGARDSYVFGTFEGEDLPEIPGNPSLPAVVLYKSFDEGSAVFPGTEVDAEELAAFVKGQSVPLFDQLGPENFATYAEASLPIAYLFIDPEDTSRQSIIDGLQETTKALRGEVNFVWIDGVKFAEYGKTLGAQVDNLPAFVLHDLETSIKFVLPEKATADGIHTFVTGALLGEVEPTVKSQPIPETQDEPVYKLTTLGWDNLFGDSTKDVFAEFYAPWCGHCQRLAPTWDTLGDKYKNSNVVIAQMDATENDIPPTAPFKVQGFPTLKFRPAGSEEWVDYQGDRSLESLVEFIEANRKGEAVEARDVVEDEAVEEAVQEETPAHDEL